jgi:hypothetical protein
VAIDKKKFKVTTDSAHHLPVFEKRLNRDFSTTAIIKNGHQILFIVCPELRASMDT